MRAWRLYLGLAAAGTAVYFLAPGVAGNGAIFNLLGISASIAILVGVRKHRPSTWVPWALFATAQALFVTGDVLYYTLPGIFHYTVDFPSLGDVFYVAVYPLIILGLVLLIRARTPHRDWEALIDAAIIGIGVGVVSWVFLMVPYATRADLSFGTKTLSITYPFMDVLVLTVTARLAVGAGRRAPAFYFMLAGLIALVTTDSIYGFIELNGTYQTGSILDIGWLIYYFCWGAAALHPSMRTLSERVGGANRSLTRGRLLVLAAAALLAPIVEATRLGSTQLSADGMLVGGSIALFILVVLRLRLAALRQESAAQRERALREAGAALVSASSAAELGAAAAAAAADLAPAVHARLLVTGADLRELFVVSALDDDSTQPVALSLRALADEQQEQLLQGKSVRVDAIPDPWVTALKPLTTPALIVPLMAQAKVIGLLLVGGQRSTSDTLRSSFEALGSQMALALEAVTLTRERYLQQSEQRLHALVRNSSEVISVIDMRGTVLYQSPSIERVFGYEPASVIGANFLTLVDPADRPAAAALLAKAATVAETAEPLTLETRLFDASGAWRDVELRYSAGERDDVGKHVVVNTRDVSDRRTFEQRLAHQLGHDPLTDLPNRASFLDHIDVALAAPSLDSPLLAILIVDIDDFKRINDSLGYAAGDELIGSIATRLRAAVSDGDTVARLGGDEFAVLLLDSNENQAKQLIAALQTRLSEPFRLHGRDVMLTVSVGLTVADRASGATAADLVRDAGIALNVAKHEASGDVRAFDASMRDTAVRRLTLATDLQQAIAQDQLRLVFQPLVELQTGRIVGAEALVRWAHPVHGMLTPADFIPLAEATGLILPMGRWIVEEACRTAAALRHTQAVSEEFSVAVNLSAMQLREPGLAVEVEEALRAAGLAPRDLTLEITESMMMHDAESSAARLRELADLGIELAVDDFGTGYSSLSYLRQFPVNVLKIDKSFVDSVHRSRDDRAIARAIVQLAGALELRVIAEGIEEERQLQQLLRLGCRFGQGFLLAKPMPAAALRELLKGGGIPQRKQSRAAGVASLTAA